MAPKPFPGIEVSSLLFMIFNVQIYPAFVHLDTYQELNQYSHD